MSEEKRDWSLVVRGLENMTIGEVCVVYEIPCPIGGSIVVKNQIDRDSNDLSQAFGDKRADYALRVREKDDKYILEVRREKFKSSPISKKT